MSSSISPLFTPVKIGSRQASNRIFMSAMTRSRAPGAVPSAVVSEYYKQRATEGSGLIVSEGILVTRQGTEWPNAPGIWNKEQVAAWKKVTDEVHSAGSLIYAQLWHVGRVAHPDAPEQKLAGTPVYAPSAIAARGGKFRFIPGEPGYVTPTAVEDPWTLVEHFRQAAINAKEAGFDGAEIHGANGYLVVQFLDSGANQRTDQWGGSVENRARFGLEVVKAVKESFGDDVAIKVSPAGGYNDVGMPLPETIETYKYFLSEVDKLGVSYIALSRYNAFFDPKYDGVPRGVEHDFLATYRSSIKNAKVVLNGGVTATEGAGLVTSGTIDAIAIGFNFITHPDLVKRILLGKALDNTLDYLHIQGGEVESELHLGYTDYPIAVY